MNGYNIVNYSYVIVDKASKLAAVVDPAWNLNKIVYILDEYNAKLTTILTTHSHYDHVNLVNSLVDIYNAKVYMSTTEINYYNYKSKNLQGLEDEQVIVLGNTHITCRLTPGHTPGSMCFFLIDKAFTGDTIFTEGCGACSFVGGCPSLMFDSIQRIKRTVSPDTAVFPGHSFGKSPGKQLGFLLKNNIYFQIDKKEVFINFRMRKHIPAHFFC